MRPPHGPQIRLYQDWLARERGLRFETYDALWRWSVTDLDAFWQSVWDYFDLRSPTPHTAVLARRDMPGAQWFPGAQVNYARQVFRHVDAAHAAGLPALVARSERDLITVSPPGCPQGGTAPSGGSEPHAMGSVGATVPPPGRSQGGTAPSGGSEPHAVGERGGDISWPELRRRVASLALHLKAQGLQPGDRVAAYLPNIPEAMVAFLAVVSLGGIWSICSPDMGTAAVLDRFKQIEPVVLIGCDGVTYGGRDLDRRGVLAELRAALPTVRHVLVHHHLDAINLVANCTDLALTTGRNDAEVAAFEPIWLPFDHPAWIVYSSGTTGLPKPIVHGHGGAIVVSLALKCLHNDIGCSYAPNSFGERYHWYSSTGWVMWNAQMSGLLNGTTCVIYDGNPGGATVDANGQKVAPEWTTLWRFAAQTGVTFFGAGAAFYANGMKAGIELDRIPGLGQIRALGTTGSPLSEDVQRWGTAQMRKVAEAASRDPSAAGPPQGASTPSGGSEPHAVGERGGDIWWCNISGGTDFAGAFIGGNRELPLVPGEMQCRLLGCAVEAWNEQGQPVVGEVGELVCTAPIPSMPLRFWGDTGHARYLSSYFDTYPGVWRHGDWLKVTPQGGCIIYGRSDATINRHGLRMGTSELYSAVEALPEVVDSMVVDLEYLGRPSYMPLFVALRDGLVLDAALQERLNAAIRTALSPRFLPDAIVQVPEIPRTLTGKKQELPIKKLLLGQPIDKVVNRDAMANPGCLEWYVAFAEAHRARAPQ